MNGVVVDSRISGILEAVEVPVDLNHDLAKLSMLKRLQVANLLLQRRLEVCREALWTNLPRPPSQV